MKQRYWILTLVLALLSGPLLADLGARSVDRFAIWDSGLTNAVTVTANRLVVDGSGVTQPVSIAGTVAQNISQVGGNSVVTGGVNGSQGVGGLAASGASKAGNPVLGGGVFNTTQPTVTSGQAVDAQATARGARIVATGVDDFVAVGNLTSNGAAAGAKNIGALTGVATAAAPSHTEGRAVSLSTNLAGAARVVVDEAGKVPRRIKTAGAANQDANNIVSAPTILYVADCTNSNSTGTSAWVHLYNGTGPTSASTPIVTIYAPAGGGHVYRPGPDGAAFSTALSVRFVTTQADNSTTAMASGEGICNFVTSN